MWLPINPPFPTQCSVQTCTLPPGTSHFLLLPASSLAPGPALPPWESLSPLGSFRAHSRFVEVNMRTSGGCDGNFLLVTVLLGSWLSIWDWGNAYEEVKTWSGEWRPRALPRVVGQRQDAAGGGGRSVVEGLPGMHEALGSIPSATKTTTTFQGLSVVFWECPEGLLDNPCLALVPEDPLSSWGLPR